MEPDHLMFRCQLMPITGVEGLLKVLGARSTRIDVMKRYHIATRE